jgi:hypothetical protein
MDGAMNVSEPLVLEHLNRRMAERGCANLKSDSELLASGVLDSLSLIELVSFCEKESPRTFALLIDRLRK